MPRSSSSLSNGPTSPLPAAAQILARAFRRDVREEPGAAAEWRVGQPHVRIARGAPRRPGPPTRPTEQRRTTPDPTIGRRRASRLASPGGNRGTLISASNRNALTDSSHRTRSGPSSTMRSMNSFSMRPKDNDCRYARASSRLSESPRWPLSFAIDTVPTRDRRGPTDCLRLVEDPNRRAGLSRGERSHQAGASGAEHHNVVKRILWILH